MAFSDDVRKTVEDVIQKGAGLAQMGVNMAAQMGNIAKLKAANQTEENAIRKAYTELGKRYYVAHAADENAEFSDVLQEIETAKARIQANNAKIAELRERYPYLFGTVRGGFGGVKLGAETPAARGDMNDAIRAAAGRY